MAVILRTIPVFFDQRQYLASIRAAAVSKTGCADGSLPVLNDCLKDIERTGENRDLPDMLRLKGELLLLEGSRADGEGCLRAAIELARVQEAKWWELRATVSFARFMRDTNRRDEARAMLKEIYSWFTEGFDLPDLKEAKARIEFLEWIPENRLRHPRFASIRSDKDAREVNRE
jgi:hypothetical protein